MPGALCLMITSTLESPIVCDIEMIELSLLGNLARTVEGRANG